MGVEEFPDLKAQCERAMRRRRGDMHGLYRHLAYRRIIALGSDVVPMLISELAAGNFHWFTALKEISGKNPVRPRNRNSRRKAAKDWISWFSAGMP